MALTPYYGGRIPNPAGVGNALVGMGGQQQVMTNALQQGQPFQQHPAPYQPMPNSIPYLPPQVPWGGQQHIPNPTPQGYPAYHPLPGGGVQRQFPQPQWPNPHAGAYQEWMQKFNPRGPQTP